MKMDGSVAALLASPGEAHHATTKENHNETTHHRSP